VCDDIDEHTLAGANGSCPSIFECAVGSLQGMGSFIALFGIDNTGLIARAPK
jgi:hypothetical protein